MDKDLLQLVRVIRAEIDLYRALIGHLDERTALLTENDIPALVRNNAASETLILKIKGLEDTLGTSLRSLARDLDLPPDALTLSALGERADHPAAHALQSYAAVLHDLIEQTARLNRRNAALFARRLEYLHALGGLVMGSISSYQSSGALRPPALRASRLSHEA